MVQTLEARPGAGIHEAPQGQNFFAPIARLAETLRQAKLTNWTKVFTLPESAYIYRVGKVHRGILSKFKGDVFAHQRKLTDKESHTIEVSSYGTTTYYKRKVYIVDGIPVVFINPEANKKMELLLQGDKISIEKGGRIVVHIRREVNFLNKYFDLGIKVNQEFDEKRNPVIYFSPQQKQQKYTLTTWEIATPVR